MDGRVSCHGARERDGYAGVEVRNVQLKRIDLNAAEIHLQKSKPKGGVRTIPLSADSLESVGALLVRATRLGSTHLDDYLLPALVNDTAAGKNDGIVNIRRYDPTKPTKSWRTAWRKLTVE